MRFLHGIVALIVGAGASFGALAQAPVGSTVDANALAPAPVVRQIFERSCAQCHDSARRSKPKGGFGYVLDLKRLGASEYVVAGNPDKSDLYQFLIDPDPDLHMPPPDSDAPQLSAEEIKTVHAWIVGLAAPPPASEVVSAEPAVPTPAGPEVKAEPAPKVQPPPSLIHVFARMHPMIVHFPIAMLLVAAMVDWLGLLARRQKEWLSVVRWMLGVSSITALVAVTAGWLLADQEGFKPATVFVHRWLGVATAIVSWAGWGLLEWAERTNSRWLRGAARVVILVGAILVSLTGHTGGELVYGEGYPFN